MSGVATTPLPAAATYAERTFRAVELAAEGPLSVRRLADELGVDERTARRLLGRLARAGVLARRPGRPPTFAPGPRLTGLAQRIGPPAG
jgi:DNA-binding IclR family transcriptional regulator